MEIDEKIKTEFNEKIQKVINPNITKDLIEFYKKKGITPGSPQFVEEIVLAITRIFLTFTYPNAKQDITIPLTEILKSELGENYSKYAIYNLVALLGNVLYPTIQV